MTKKMVFLACWVLCSFCAVGQIWEGDDAVDPTSWHVDENWNYPPYVPDANYGETAAIITPNRPSPIISQYTNPYNVIVASDWDLGTCKPRVVAGGELFVGLPGNRQNIYIGYNPDPAGTKTGKGEMILDGGVISNVYDLFIGYDAPSEGTFTINSGTIDIYSGPRIGWDGKGTLNVHGGSLNALFLQIGVNNDQTGSGVVGVLNIDGGSITTSSNFQAGIYNGTTGTLNMSGGTITCGGVVDIGSGAGSTAVFNLTSGTFNYTNTLRYAVGFSGNGTLNIYSGSTLNISGTLRLAQNAGSTGVVNMYGGTINTATLNVGHNVPNSSATFNLRGGTVNCSNTFNLEIGKGTMDIWDGVLIVNGDRKSYIQTRIDGGHIIGWEGRAAVTVDYNVTNPGKTTVYSTFNPADLVYAWKPSPADQGVVTLENKNNVTLSWKPGNIAAFHRIYLGADRDALDAIPAGDTSHPYYLGQTALGVETIAAPALNGNTRYYWRVDEVNNDSTITKGKRWRFDVLPYTILDNFETYADTAALTAVWSASGGTVSLVSGGNRPLPLDTKSMALAYTTGVSEATRTYSTPLNLAALGIQALYLAFHGTDTAAGLTGSLYIKLTDSSNNVATVTYSPAGDLFQYLWHPTWRTWKVKTSDFVGVDMSQIKTITLGVSSASAAATIYFDNLRAYVPACWRDKAPGDFESSDCIGTMEDLKVLSRDWAKAPVVVNAAATEPTDYIVYYSFDAGTTVGGETPAANSPGSAYNLVYPGDSAYQCEFITGVGRGFQSFGPGGINGTNCLILKNDDTFGLGVQIPKINWEPIATSQAFTISAWINGDGMQPAEDRFFRAWDDVTVSGTNTQIADIRVPGNLGDITFQVRDNVPAIVYQASDVSEFKGQWNHYAFTYDKASGVKRMYLNGVLIGEGFTTADLPAASNMDIAIGGRPSNNDASPYTRTNDTWAYSGKIDDFKMYSRALTQAEIVRLAKGAGGSVTQPPLNLRADANSDNAVNLADLAELVEIWLTQTLWP